MGKENLIVSIGVTSSSFDKEAEAAVDRAKCLRSLLLASLDVAVVVLDVIGSVFLLDLPFLLMPVCDE